MALHAATVLLYPVSSTIQYVNLGAPGTTPSGETLGSLDDNNRFPSASVRNKRDDRERQRIALADHLLVLVHGINAGPRDWDDVKEVLQSELGSKFLIHASSSNPTFQTFVGVDLAGKRLADEVRQIVWTNPGLKRISFVAHSLGGLFQRYAIANLYNARDSTIAGLEPVQFVTIATPHLGMRGSKSLPMAFGVTVLEELAAIFTVGRTARQLFLSDGELNEPPLLLRMATDCSDGCFISALRAFKMRVAYANVDYDQMVGWRTSSIRRETELTTPPNRSLDGYQHIVSETLCPAVEISKTRLQSHNVKKDAVLQLSLPLSYQKTVEEEMIRGLQQMSWKKVDMNFHSATIPFLAHNHFHVKYVWPVQFEGAGLIAHIKDSIKRLDLGHVVDMALENGI
ncbi:uncharacterized protein [Physcomitrium patens]|uniref:uncharacterized protein isoform X2 n=1 Tax=Physcomitrium patens TaxID=3218 RepID=UPI000D1581D9|nr:protein FAM135B-like isoform X2 [Physcomitrium patens]|eukprot:XP_024365990.1 protein FAM135B-like isoform X2 [Physcomitrella patens]